MVNNVKPQFYCILNCICHVFLRDTYSLSVGLYQLLWLQHNTINVLNVKYKSSQTKTGLKSCDVVITVITKGCLVVILSTMPLLV